MSLKLINKNYTYSSQLKMKAVKMYQADIPRSIILKEIGIKDKKWVNVWVK